MPRHARNRRRSLAACVDLLEERRLLSRLAPPVEAPATTSYAYNEAADRDYYNRDSPKDQALPGPSVSTGVPTSGPTEPSRETASHPRTEPEAYGSTGTESSKRDEDYYSPSGPSGPTKSADFTASATLTEPDPVSVLASNGPNVNHQQEVARRPDSVLAFTVTGIVGTAYGTVEHLPSVPGGDGEPSPLRPHAMPASPPEAPHDPGPETGAEPKPEIESPRGAGLIFRALPFSSEVLNQAVEDVLDRYADLGVRDVVGEITTERIATFGAACAATLGAVEIARRLHQRESESNPRRTPSGRMVPGLWPARSS